MTGENTVTSSHRLDRVIFAVVLSLMLLSAPRLRVYYTSAQVSPTRVELAGITSEGERVELDVPDALQGGSVREAARRVREFARTPEARSMVPQGGALEWTLRFAIVFNDSRRNRVRRLRTGT